MCHLCELSTFLHHFSIIWSFLSSLGLPFLSPFWTCDCEAKIMICPARFPSMECRSWLAQSRSAFSLALLGSSAASGQVAKPVGKRGQDNFDGTRDHWLLPSWILPRLWWNEICVSEIFPYDIQKSYVVIRQMSTPFKRTSQSRQTRFDPLTRHSTFSFQSEYLAPETLGPGL